MSLLQGIGPAHDDFADLLRAAIQPALDLLQSDGSFMPFLVLYTQDKELRLIHADDPSVIAGTGSLLERLAATATASDGVASAVVFDALSESANDIDADDAIALALRHRSGSEQLALVPYTATAQSIIDGDTVWFPAGEQPF